MASTPAANTTLANRLNGTLNDKQIVRIAWVDLNNGTGYWVVYFADGSNQQL